MPLPPLPPGMEVIGWIFWLVILFLLGGAVVIIAKSVFPGFLHQISQTGSTGSEYPSSLDKTMGELLDEIRMLRREIEELRKDLRE